jgi:hypothetical protein
VHKYEAVSYRESLPESGRQPEMPLFNLDVMSDEQIIVLYRGASGMADLGPQDNDQFDQVSIGSYLCDKLAAEVADLAARDPERVKELAGQLFASDKEADRELAAHAAASIARYNLVFSISTLISLMLKQECVGDFGWETAHDKISILMRDHMTPDQVESLRAHLAGLGSDFKHIEPALPDEG